MPMNIVVRTVFCIAGWRTMLSMAWPIRIPKPAPDPITPGPKHKPAAISAAA
jgi:hypothetical protein